MLKTEQSEKADMFDNIQATISNILKSNCPIKKTFMTGVFFYKRCKNFAQEIDIIE